VRRPFERIRIGEDFFENCPRRSAVARIDPNELGTLSKTGTKPEFLFCEPVKYVRGSELVVNSAGHGLAHTAPK
jgi:hypothetical protein